MQISLKLLGVTGVLVVMLCGCEKPGAPQAATPAQASPFIMTAGIKDIMAHMIDPAADALWASVSIEQTLQGEVKHEPKTDADWHAVRGHAIVLMESANLLMMEGRRVARAGHELEDSGTPGNLTAEEAEKAIAADRATYISFANALHAVGEEMLKAAETKNAEIILDRGGALDAACEGCHLKFWYPGQNIPAFPDQAPEPAKQ